MICGLWFMVHGLWFMEWSQGSRVWELGAGHSVHLLGHVCTP